MKVGDFNYLRRLAAERSQNSKLIAAEKDFQEALVVFHKVEDHLRQQVTSIAQALAERDGLVAGLTQSLAERDGRIASLMQTLAERDERVATLTQTLAENEHTLSAILRSHSWKMTRPLRSIARTLRSAMPNAARRLPLTREWLIIRKSRLFDSNSYIKNNPDVAHFSWGPLWHYLITGASEGRDPQTLFDTSFYVEQYPDVARAGLNPLFHYIRRGATEGRDPHPLFDTSFYLERYPDVARAGVNPLFHYIRRGATEGRDPHPLFDTSYYLERNPDVAKGGVNPLAHYLLHGACEGRDPHPLFDTSYYLEKNPDVAKGGVNPLAHYLLHGACEGRDPHPLFDTSYYLEQNPGVVKAGENLLTHYLNSGAYQGIDPHPLFDSSYYLHQNPDVQDLSINPLVHYIEAGIAEGRDPSPDFDTSDYLERHPEVALTGLNPLVHYLMNGTQFNLRAALRNEFELSGRLLLGSEYDSHPLVSVIIPCFNQAHFLEDALLSSLLACSHPMEIIVVDDGSTDAPSFALMDQLVDRYKFILVRQANTGRASARNAGIQRARGEFVQLLDADDMLAPRKIDIQVSEFRADPEIDICISEYELCNSAGLNRRVNSPSTIDGFSLSTQDFLLRWERGLSIPIHCPLFRRKLLEQTNFRLVTHSAHEDWIFWIELSLRSPKFKFTPDVLASYRIHGRNTTTNHEVMALDFLRACMYIAEAGLNKGNEAFLHNSIQHFHTCYLESIKRDARLSASADREDR